MVRARDEWPRAPLGRFPASHPSDIGGLLVARYAPEHQMCTVINILRAATAINNTAASASDARAHTHLTSSLLSHTGATINRDKAHTSSPQGLLLQMCAASLRPRPRLSCHISP
ncbi:hypothetical protein J6590_059819 [Homalodisca vitripennis]|nr:hypothetical protein J6590_059819 [Homalodisca vitripennis]